MTKHGSHLVFTPPASHILPRPANGATYDAPDDNGQVHSWAHDEAIAEVKAWGRADPKHRPFAQAFIFDLYDRDQVCDAGNYGDLSENAQTAINKGTANVRFANVSTTGNAQPLPALGADGHPLPEGGQAWQGLNPQGEPIIALADDSLLEAYRQMFQHNLNVGYTGG